MKERQQELAHDCGLIVVSDSSTRVRYVKNAKVPLSYPEAYDLISLPKMDLANRLVRWFVGAAAQTAVSLHRNEEVVFTSGCVAPHEFDASAARLNIAQNRLVVADTVESDTLILTCMDWRLWQQGSRMRELLQKAGWENSTVMTIPGVAAKLVGTDDSTYILAKWQLMHAFDVMGVRRLIILAHQDCGAYGGSKFFPDHECEMGTYDDHTTMAARRLLQDGLPFEIVTGVILLAGNLPTDIRLF